eukprot:m.186311 g.186311  ORF g.186311 m.186311 type:complete len:62 (-) comp53559_c0_seq7:1217-1402(-)
MPASDPTGAPNREMTSAVAESPKYSESSRCDRWRCHHAYIVQGEGKKDWTQWVALNDALCD